VPAAEMGSGKVPQMRIRKRSGIALALVRASGLSASAKAIDKATKSGWVVVDMKSDWKRIFKWE
jgi:hypothetical protein